MITRGKGGTRAWASLFWPERAAILLVDGGPETAARVDTILSEAAIARGECRTIGDVWLSATIPTGAVMVRDDNGLWRILPYAADSTAADPWTTRGRA